jgi:acyl-coenzyme A thioesterase PaaI-like protein
MAPDFERIPGRYGYSLERTGDLSVAGRMPLLASLTDPDGAMRPAAMLMAIDMTCGMAGGLGVLPLWTVTADAEIHFLGECTVGPLRVDARCIRAGRAMSVVEARVVDEGAGDALVAIVTANHGVLESDFSHFLATASIGDVKHFDRPDHPDDESLEQYFGLELTRGVHGTQDVAPTIMARLALDRRTTNPWGILHGGLHGLLVDTTARQAGMERVTDVVLRFLNPVRSGPAVAMVSDDLRRGGDRVVRIEVRDEAADRLVVLAHVVGH